MLSKEFTKKAVEMLLKGATLVSDPCPYCKGVRIIQNGNALCVNCGKQGRIEAESNFQETEGSSTRLNSLDRLDLKIKDLTAELQKEKDFAKQKQILYSINEIIAIKEKLRKF